MTNCSFSELKNMFPKKHTHYLSKKDTLASEKTINGLIACLSAKMKQLNA